MINDDISITQLLASASPTQNLDDPFNLEPIIDAVMGQGNYKNIEVRKNKAKIKNKVPKQTQEQEKRSKNENVRESLARPLTLGDCMRIRLSRRLLFHSRRKRRSKGGSLV